MNKIISVILFLLCLVFLAGTIMSCSVRASAGLSPEAGTLIVFLGLAGVCFWGGLKLWRK